MFLLVFLAALLFSIPITSRASGVTGPEAREMAGLAQLIQAYLDQNGHAPGNWSEIWNEDRLLKAKARRPELAPLYDRYSFVANRYPIYAKSGDDAIEGTIVLMHNEVFGLASGTGGERWFVYVTPGNRALVGSLTEGQLSSGNGVGRFRLLAPDLSQQTVAAFERKLVILGYTSQHRTPGAAPALEIKYASPPP